MEADYNPESTHHSGSIPVQEAKAHLGVFKRTSEVPARYRLSNFERQLDADEVWIEFIDSRNRSWSENTEYKYWSPWEKWCSFAKEERGIHPLTPAAEDLEAWFGVVITESSTIQTAHDLHFRVLQNLFEWLTEHTEYPHRYNPVMQAVLIEEAAATLWTERLSRRKKYEDKDLFADLNQ